MELEYLAMLAGLVVIVTVIILAAKAIRIVPQEGHWLSVG